MSSTESISSEPTAGGPEPGPARGSVALVVVTLALLAALAWALHPDRPPFKPAPLEPRSDECPKVPRAFIPSNVTEILVPSLEGLTPKQKNRALFHMNMEPCPCGCSLSIAACRVNNPACETSKKLAAKIIKEVKEEAAPKE